jgi:hypothetical protein
LGHGGNAVTPNEGGKRLKLNPENESQVREGLEKQMEEKLTLWVWGSPMTY